MCHVGLHRWTVFGRPGSKEAYKACRRCRKKYKWWRIGDPNETNEFFRSGLDEKSQEQKKYFFPGG